MNVASLFDAQAQRSPDAPALRWGAKGMTYAALREQAIRFSSLLKARGIGVDDRVALLLPNDGAFAVALLGTLWHGATAVVLSAAWAQVDAERALEKADARLLVTTRDSAAALTRTDPPTITVDDDEEMGALGVALREATFDASRAPAHRSPGDVASIMFSSGTTSEPKGVMLTHGNLAFNARAKIRYCGIAPTDRLAMVVPMSHCFGQNVVLLGALLAGAAVVIHPRFDAERVRDDIAKGDVTMLLAAPTAFARLLCLRDDETLRRLRYALTAAAPLPEDVASGWRAATGRALAQGYGLTECSPFAVHDGAAPDAGRRVGWPIEGVEVRIASFDRVGWMADGLPGEICIRGPNVMAGYWRSPEATAAALRDGWLHTGDVGLLDPEGALHLVDRIDDVINVAGFKTWPSDVERVLRRHPLVRDAAVFGLPDPVRGSVVSAVVVLDDAAAADDEVLEQILAFAARSLASYQRPARLRAAAALPRSASGKVLRRVLAAEFLRPPEGQA